MALAADRRRGRFGLIALTAVWGSTFVVLQSTLETVSPLRLIAARYVLAGMALVALRQARLAPALAAIPRTWSLSLSMLAGFALQTSGLLTTTPSRSAFVSAMSVLLVAPADFLLRRHLPTPLYLLAVALAAAGVWVLFHPIGSEWRVGDTLTALAAVCFAVYVVELGRLARTLDAGTLVMAQCIVIGALAALLSSWLETPRLGFDPGTLLALAYLGVVCTAANFLLMTWGQARVEPLEAAIIYTLEPVFAAAFSIAAGRESLTVNLLAGGAMVFVATLLSGRAAAEAAPVADHQTSGRT